MSAECVTGKPKPRRLFKRRRITTAYQALRIRFGLLGARRELAEAMTPDQTDYLRECELHGWMIGDAGTLRAYDREIRRLGLADFWAGWGK